MLASFAVVYSLFIINYSRRKVEEKKRVKKYGIANSELSLPNHDAGKANEPNFSPSPSVGPGNEPCSSLSEVNTS